MRALVVVLLSACGAPSWPEVREPDGDTATRLGVVPVDPIAGEHVDVVLPVCTDGDCLAWSGRRETAVAGGVTTITFVGEPSTCPVVRESGSGSLQALGPLEEGRYAIVVGELAFAFEVRPASTHPGEPPLWRRAAQAVAEVQPVPSACRSDVGEPVRERPYRARSARLFQQIAAHRPSWSPDEIESALCRTQMVRIAEVSPRELRYRYVGGGMCLVREVIGTIRVRDDGTLEVGEPHVIREERVDC